MALSANQRAAVWLIIAICLISVPVSMFVHRDEGSKSDESSDSSQFKSLMSMRDRISVIRLSGMIVDKDQSSLLAQIGSCTSAKKALRKALKDDHVKAVLLRINSPGGTVATSQELQEAVLAVREAGKPVVASMGDVAASGGYYVASAADKIIAEPGTITGSIGVIINLVNLQGIEEKLGIKPAVVKSGQFKDVGSPNRPITAEEENLLKSIIMDSYDQFINAVATGRKMPLETVRKLADGRVYSGRQALKVGLIDELGGYEAALKRTQTLARERFKLKDDLKVDDGEGLGFVSALLESTSDKLSSPGVFGGLVPESMQGEFRNTPLWMMQ